jgi:hypothetical protein
MGEDAMEQSGSDMALRRRGVMLTRMQRLALRAHGAALALHAWTPARIALHPLSVAVAATLILIAGAPSPAVLALLVQIGLAIWMAQRDPPPPAPPRAGGAAARAAALPPLVAITPAPDDRAVARAALRLPPARVPRRADPDRRMAVQDQAIALAARVAAVGIEVRLIAIGDADGDWVAWALIGAEPLLVRAAIRPAPARTAVLPDSDPTLAWIVTTVLPPPPAPDALLSSLLAMPPPPAPRHGDGRDGADPDRCAAPEADGPRHAASAAPEGADGTAGAGVSAPDTNGRAASAAPEADGPRHAASAAPEGADGMAGAASAPDTNERAARETPDGADGTAASAAPEADGPRHAERDAPDTNGRAAPAAHAAAAVVAATLERFGVAASVAWVRSGPALHVVGLAPADGVSVRRVEALRDDLGLALATPKVRVVAPADGPYVAVEIPRGDRTPVALRDLWTDPAALWCGDLPVPLGRDGGGAPIIIDLAAQPHILVAGATGSGKSMLLHAWLTTLLLRQTPDAARVALIDLKRVELEPRYGGAPHLWDAPATTEAAATALLRRLVAEMEARYAGLQQRGLRDLGAWRRADSASAPPLLVLVVDEVADLLATDESGAAAAALRALTRKARAAGIHLALATQRPSVDVLAGEIKANIPARVALALPTATDSQVALGQAGAETLLGAGDLLYRSPDGALVRAQAPLVAWEDGAWPPPRSRPVGGTSRDHAPTPDDLARRSGLLIHPDAAVRAAWVQRLMAAAQAAGARFLMADPARPDDPAPAGGGGGETPVEAARTLAALALLARQRAAAGGGADAPWVVAVVRGLDAHLAAWRAHTVAVGSKRRSMDALAQAALVETLAAHAQRVAVWLVASAPPDATDLAPATWEALRRHGWTLAPGAALPAPVIGEREPDGRRCGAAAADAPCIALHGAVRAAPWAGVVERKEGVDELGAA